MSDVKIRQASVGDIDELMAWRMETLREVFSIPTGADTVALESENRAYYLRELAAGGHIACFAEIDDEVVGCGGVCIHAEMPSPDNQSGTCAYLMNIYTRPEAQRQGVGARVVEWLIAQSRKRGAEKVYLETSEAARRLYQKLGFEDLLNFMILKSR